MPAAEKHDNNNGGDSHLSLSIGVFLVFSVIAVIAMVMILIYIAFNQGNADQAANEEITDHLQNATDQNTVILVKVDDQINHTNVVLGVMNQTQREIAELTNDIYIMQKSELESRKTLGQFLALVARNNNITIPEDLRQALLIDNPEPKQSAPPNY